MTEVVLLALALSSAAPAEKWEKTYNNEHATAYVDVRSIIREGATAKATFRRDYADPATRKSFDENGRAFPLARTMSVEAFDCDGDEHTIEKIWDLSPDGKQQSPVKSYPKSKNNDTWDAAAKKAVCAAKPSP